MDMQDAGNKPSGSDAADAITPLYCLLKRIIIVIFVTSLTIMCAN